MFKVAGEGQTDCSQLNGEVISDCSICKLAAEKLGHDLYLAETESHYPHGCYKYVDGIYMAGSVLVYCNQHPVGGADRYASPICKVGIPFGGKAYGG